MCVVKISILLLEFSKHFTNILQFNLPHITIAFAMFIANSCLHDLSNKLTR